MALLDVQNINAGYGETEILHSVSIQVNEDDNPDLEILVVRDISAKEYSNLFSQLSLHTQEIASSDRLITNLGIGYRKLSDDKSSMFGINSFIDYDLEGHTRGSVGICLLYTSPSPRDATLSRMPCCA